MLNPRNPTTKYHAATSWANCSEKRGKLTGTRMLVFATRQRDPDEQSRFILQQSRRKGKQLLERALLSNLDDKQTKTDSWSGNKRP